jgi:hypothetical protein
MPKVPRVRTGLSTGQGKAWTAHCASRFGACAEFMHMAQPTTMSEGAKAWGLTNHT